MHRQLIELVGRIGARFAVQRQYACCVRMLARELGAAGVCWSVERLSVSVRFITRFLNCQQIVSFCAYFADSLVVKFIITCTSLPYRHCPA